MALKKIIAIMIAVLFVAALLVPFAAQALPADYYEDPQEAEKIAAALDWHTVKGCTLTAYCPCRECCGEWSGGPTYSGVMPQGGHTIAVDPAVIPLGAWVEIGGELYHAEDTGGGIKGKHIDVFFNSHAVANGFGRKTGVTVRWYE